MGTFPRCPLGQVELRVKAQCERPGSSDLGSPVTDGVPSGLGGTPNTGGHPARPQQCCSPGNSHLGHGGGFCPFGKRRGPLTAESHAVRTGLPAGLPRTPRRASCLPLPHTRRATGLHGVQDCSRAFPPRLCHWQPGKSPPRSPQRGRVLSHQGWGGGPRLGQPVNHDPRLGPRGGPRASLGGLGHQRRWPLRRLLADPCVFAASGPWTLRPGPCEKAGVPPRQCGFG